MGNETNSNGSGGAVLDEARVRAIVRSVVCELFMRDVGATQCGELRTLGEADPLEVLCAKVGSCIFQQYRAEPGSQAHLQRLERQARGRETQARADEMRAVAEAAEREAEAALQRADLPAEMRGGLATVARERATAAREQASQLSTLATALMQ